MPNILKPLALALLAGLLAFSSCARTVRDISAGARRIVFQLSVRGRLALNNPNVTYYIVLNAPEQSNLTLDPATQGPRINGPSLNDPATTLFGRLPFLGLLPGDIQSEWTDFYFLQGTADGQGMVGRGVRRSDGTPEIVLRNYSSALWKKVSDSTVEIQMVFSDLVPTTNFPNNFVVHLATSDSIDTGQGYVYDWWRSNLPFSIDTAPNNTPISDQDVNSQLVLRQIPGKPLPVLPTGVNPDDVNILSYEYRVLEL
ncbi:MAG: hypothetical protein ACO1RX_01410 [Candidatus Sericytochromatia bacterium]